MEDETVGKSVKNTWEVVDGAGDVSRVCEGVWELQSGSEVWVWQVFSLGLGEGWEMFC